jgi:hypothetical protein
VSLAQHILDTLSMENLAGITQIPEQQQWPGWICSSTSLVRSQAALKSCSGRAFITEL